MIELVRSLVEKLLSEDKSGHGMEHVNRVYNLAMKFAQKETCDSDLVALGALLHDVDDYKIFGEESQKKLINTNRILDEICIDDDRRSKVIDIIKSIGYKKRLNGMIPLSIEVKIVSDADMCDALGVVGILRTHQFSLINGKEFFDRNNFPVEDIEIIKQNKKLSDTSVDHMFEKILRLKDFMLTESGKQEAEKRHEFCVKFLYQLFEEENANEWKEYLDRYLEK